MKQMIMPIAIIIPAVTAHYGNYLPRRESIPILVEKERHK